MDLDESPIVEFTVDDALRDREESRKAYLILKYSHESAKSFLDAFETVRAQRGAQRGATTDEEQDLLRAMVVMAAASLDSLLKQIIRDSVPTLIHLDESVWEGLEKFLARRLRTEAEEATGAKAHAFLARILAADSQQAQVIEEYVHDLTGTSLQSDKEVMKAISALGLEAGELEIDASILKPIFETRNRIIHEFDINFEAARRNRQSRTMEQMISHTNNLLTVATAILEGVYAKLEVGEQDT